ncbi:MAG: hypothetical protein WC551_08445 [Patescibacteria group bacterium]
MSKRSKYCLAAIVLMGLLGMPLSAAAAPADVTIPGAVHYNARLADADGKPLNDTVSVRAFIYDSATEGMSGDLDDARLLYAEDFGDVSIVRGRLSLTIGKGEPLGSFAGFSLPLRALAEAEGLYLELEVEGERISPRQRIGFSKSSQGAAYARRAKNLNGAYTISTSSFPEDLPANKINCSGSRPDLNSTRISSVPIAKISGVLPKSTMPSNIPLSKIDPSGGSVAAARLPNVSASSVQSGKFASSERLPDAVLAPEQLLIGGSDGGGVLSGGSTGVSGASCSCMAALHSTTGGGAEGMNVVDIEMDPHGGAVSCNMSFEEGGVWSRKSAPECQQYPPMDGSNDPNALCDSYCTDLCCTMPGCLGAGEQQCKLNCTMSCNSCYQAGSVSLPCNVSYLCMCID